MRVTVLMENNAPEGCGLVPEHGLSVYIEYKGKKILLDAGSSGTFADNAAELGVDLSQVELAALSHGHYDHADGLRRFFQVNNQANVYVRHGMNAPLFAIDPDVVRFVGVHKDVWSQGEGRFVPVEGVVELMDGVWLTPGTVHDPDFAGRAGNLVYKRGEDDFIPDDFRHEQSLVFDTEDGLVVFNSCSHSGIVNIVRGIKQLFPNRPVRAVVGGLHMFSNGPTGMNCSPAYVYAVADELKALGVKEVYTGHCTGDPALALLQERFGAGCRKLMTGMTFEL